MRIEKWINIDQEIKIDLSSDDIRMIFDSEVDSLKRILWGLNDVATFLKGISQEKISEMNSEQRLVIRNFLLIEAEKYNETGR